jgi:hypothetical protein
MGSVSNTTTIIYDFFKSHVKNDFLVNVYIFHSTLSPSSISTAEDPPGNGCLLGKSKKRMMRIKNYFSVEFRTAFALIVPLVPSLSLTHTCFKTFHISFLETLRFAPVNFAGASDFIKRADKH